MPGIHQDMRIGPYRCPASRMNGPLQAEQADGADPRCRRDVQRPRAGRDQCITAADQLHQLRQ